MKRWECVQCGLEVAEQHTRMVLEPEKSSAEPLPCMCIPCVYEFGVAPLLDALRRRR